MKKNSVLIFIVFLFEASVVLGYKNEKCCKSRQIIIEKKLSFACEMNNSSRIQSYFKETDFFSKNTSGSCIEVYSHNKTARFSLNVSTRRISKMEDINAKYFHKCCPLMQKYNNTIHACALSNNNDYLENILEADSFLKVGLPQCKIISDKLFFSYQDLLKHVKETLSNSENYCVDSTVNGDFVVRKCEENDQICAQVRCIHKCCPDGQSYVNGSKCFDTFKYGVDLHSNNEIHVPEAPFVIIHGIKKPIFMLTQDSYNISIDKTGLFSIHRNESHFHFPVSHNKYCMEHTRAGNWNGYYLFSTGTEPEVKQTIIITRWLKIVSCIFLLLTILVYVLVPKMRNLFGNIILCYSIASFLMYFFLAISQFFHDKFYDIQCKVLGFLNIIAVIWSFTWLHLMCIEIWRSLRIPRNTTGPLQKNELMTMLKYSLLGWGFPILWVMLIALLSNNKNTHNAIRPHIGEMKCFIEGSDTRKGNYAQILFVVLPLAIQQIINTLLFANVIKYYIFMEKMRDVSSQRDIRAGKDRFILIVKLTVIMGTSFLFDTVSSLFDFSSYTVTEYIEVVWDSINCLQGVFIFIVFICKKKVYNHICNVIPCFHSMKISLSSSSKTHQLSLQQIDGNNDV